MKKRTIKLLSLLIIFILMAGCANSSTASKKLIKRQQKITAIHQDTPENVAITYYAALLNGYTNIIKRIDTNPDFIEQNKDTINNSVSKIDKICNLQSTLGFNDGSFQVLIVRYDCYFNNVKDSVKMVSFIPLIKNDNKWYIYTTSQYKDNETRIINETLSSESYIKFQNEAIQNQKQFLEKHPEFNSMFSTQ